MNHRIIRLLSLCLPAVLLIAGCQSNAQKLLPVTGVEEVSFSAQAALARDNVLDYLLSSTRIAGMPSSADWVLEVGEQSEREHRFRSGDWLMLIQMAGASDENQKVILINKVQQVSWSGYIKPDGSVVDTSYGR